MERKRLIRPITVEKVKQFLKEVVRKVNAEETFSLDKVCREHSISGSNSTAIIRLGWLLETDVKFRFYFNPQSPFLCDDKHAKMLIEEVRSHTGKVASGESISKTNRSVVTTESKSKDEADINLPKKTLISPEIASVLNKIENAMNVIAQKDQVDLFGGIKDVHSERVHVASSIASAVFGGSNAEHFARMSEGAIQEINEKIIFATSDLMDKILNFKAFTK